MKYFTSTYQRNLLLSGAYKIMSIQKHPTRILCALAALVVFPLSTAAETVGNVDVDWLGNDIVVEAVADPKVKGVTCHLAYFERGIIDRLQKGNWFEDPSNSSISCRQTGPIEIGDIERDDEGETVFTERRSVIFKTLNVKRIYDEANNTLIYISHARDVQNGSAKMSMSTVPLYVPGN
jgi:CreA protein